MTDKMFILGLRAEAIIGVYDWERDIRQPLEFDIELLTNAAAAAATDKLEDAVDYATISKRVIEEVEASSYQLIETLAEHVAAMILREFGVRWLQLRIMKPTAVPEADGVGLVIERGFADLM